MTLMTGSLTHLRPSATCILSERTTCFQDCNTLHVEATDGSRGIFASRFEKAKEALWLVINKGEDAEIDVQSLAWRPAKARATCYSRLSLRCEYPSPTLPKALRFSTSTMETRLGRRFLAAVQCELTVEVTPQTDGSSTC